MFKVILHFPTAPPSCEEVMMRYIKDCDQVMWIVIPDSCSVSKQSALLRWL
jgi:hypothetical protein